MAHLATIAPDPPPVTIRRDTLRTTVEYGLATGLLALLFLLMLPSFIRLFAFAGVSITLSPALLIVSAEEMGVISFRLRRVLQPAFPDTFIPSASDDVLPTTEDAERSATAKVGTRIH